MGSRSRTQSTSKASNGPKTAQQTITSNNYNNVNQSSKFLQQKRKTFANQQQDNQRIGLILNSSDGLEGFSCSSQSSACDNSNNVNGYFQQHLNNSNLSINNQQAKELEKNSPNLNHHHHHHHQVHHLKYINNGGAIFTVASNIQHNPSSSARSSLNKQQSYIFQQAQQTEPITTSTGVLNFNPSNNSLVDDIIDNNQENLHNLTNHTRVRSSTQLQHQRLQQEVHQQLAKIYGSGANNSFKPVQQQAITERNQFLLHRHKQQVNQRSLAANAAAIANKRQSSSAAAATITTTTVSEVVPTTTTATTTTTTKLKPTVTMFKNHQHHHLMSSTINNNQPLQEQTYDSLTPESSCRNQFSDNFYITSTMQENLLTNNRNGSSLNNSNQTTAQQPICSITEEECDNLINHDDGDLLLPDRRRYLIRETDNNRQQPSSGNIKGPSVDRKSQLENLHYATVTAAALLNATANAAAAIAATEKQFNGSSSSSSNNNNNHNIGKPQQSVYSDTYQEIRKQRHQQNYEYNNQLSNAIAANKLKLIQQQRELLDSNNNNGVNYPIYADAYDNGNNNQLKDRRPPITPPHICNSTSALYGPLLRGNHSTTNPLIYNIQHQPPHTKPPQPPARLRNIQSRQPNIITNGLTNQQVAIEAFIRQQQQQQNQHRLLLQQRALAQHHHHQHHHHQLHQNLFSLGQQSKPQPPPIPTALAIVHHRGGKNSSMKADLIGRLLFNNMITAQQQRNVAEAQHYAVGLNRNHPIPIMANNDNGKVFNNELFGRQLIGIYNNNNQKQDSKNKQIYAVPPPLFTLPPVTAGIASSNSSGSSNVPLVIRKPTGIIDRICTIDLTVFWWSLLIVSFFFISIVIAISRYIF